MNHKPNIKQCWKRAVVGINLTTGERREWPSVTKAAAFCGMSVSWFGHLLRGRQVANGWLCAYADDQDWVADRIEYMKRSGKYTFNKNTCKASSSKGKVALRIDSRTVIYVDRKKANETYAEEYRKRLEAQKTERYEPVDKTDSKRKRGGRR